MGSGSPLGVVMTVKIKVLLALGVTLGLSACASNAPATRLDTGSALTIASNGGPTPQRLPSGPTVLAAKYAVQGIEVVVPRSLKVSEANGFKPRADIVWHGDPYGDRYAQVQALVAEAASETIAPMTEGRPVMVQLTLTRFHALTEKARYTFGGMHEMRFDMTVRDAATGEVLEGPRLIVADIRASGGAQAIAEEQAGRTQKVVVIERLVDVLRRELSAPVAPGTLMARATDDTTVVLR